MINGVNFSSYHNYGITGTYGNTEQNKNAAQSSSVNPNQTAEQTNASDQSGKISQNGIKPADNNKKNATGAEECETCKKRKYQDGSNENVSYKSAAHISPEAAGSAVRAHEGEHVSNAYSKAAEKEGKVINASVTLKTAICPECGRTYVSGGETNTMIKYNNEENPYVRDKKLQDATIFMGQNVDLLAG